jgi:hypothetical protein
MTQLIENKPRQRALIATLSHFWPLRRALPFLIANPRLESRVSQRKQTLATRPNGEFLRDFPSHPTPRDPLATVSLIDRGYRLEIALTHRKQKPTANSNRRWIAKLLNAVSFAQVAALYVALLVFFASSAAAAANLKSDYPVPEDGAIKNAVYINEYFGLRYPLPANWTEDLAGPEPSVNGYYSLVSLKPADTLGATILIAAQDNFFSAQPASSAMEFLTQTKQALDSSNSMSVLAGPSELKIDGRSFARLDYEGAGLHHAVFVTEVRCHFLLFSLTSNDPEQLEALVKSLNKISFAASAGAPWPSCVKDYATAANLLHRVNPDLTGPRFASVPVRLIVGTNGKVLHVHPIAGFPDQKKSVAAALAQWEFKPYLVNGRAVEVETGVLFEFRQNQ